MEMTLADNFCNGIPAAVVAGVQTFGIPLTGSQVYDSASAHLDSAIALSNASGRGNWWRIHQAAFTLKARVLVDKGQVCRWRRSQRRGSDELSVYV